MRRYNRPGAGGTLHAPKMNGSGIPDPISLIRSFDSEITPTRPVRPSPLSASMIQGLPLDLVERLRSFPLFLSAPDSFLIAIGSFLRPQLYSPNDYILTEGDDAKAMYWLVRGGLKVTSRDGESTYAELKPGAFFGEIGILMDMPRTATVSAKMKSLVVRLNKEDLKKVLPGYPEVERSIRDEATERLTILEKKKKEISQLKQRSSLTITRIGKRPREGYDGDVEMGDVGMLRDGEVFSSKKRKSPSPSLADTLASSALGSGSVSVRQLVKNLPLFTPLPDEILHFIGLNAQPRNYPPFTDVIKQGSTGRDVFFIVRGEVEVLHETPIKVNGNLSPTVPHRRVDSKVKARLKSGQYFGEVTSLSLAPRRTATVRTVSSVECLMISGDVLDELWQRCSPNLRRQVERTARERRAATLSDDIHMADADHTPAIGQLDLDDVRPHSPKPLPSVSFAPDAFGKHEDKIEACDPDPYFNIDLENVRSRSRRGSLAPPSPSTTTPPSEPSDGSVCSKSPLTHGLMQLTSRLIPRSDPSDLSSPRKPKASKRLRTARHRARDGIGILPDPILVTIFQHLDVLDLMKLRLISLHWMKLISTNKDILHVLDLTAYNKHITDAVMMNVICPFVGERPRIVDISNCFHLTDEGFSALANTCAAGVKIWKMKSVWDITGQAVLDMVNKAKGLEEADLSNCRKVGDNLLARVIGWVVPELSMTQQMQQQQQIPNRRFGQKTPPQQQQQQQQPQATPGTVIGCPQLKRLTLSYCKHITDKTMAHIAVHASSRIEEMNLTRCTTITDIGFQHWSIYQFPRLTRLCLADCTYLTDQAIVALTNAAKGLKELDLSFCCALSDMATEVLSLQCPSLTRLNMAFCGSAVSDGSLATVGRHLLELRALSVRGCVRVTGSGVDAVVDGCPRLKAFDVSQCKNLQRWLDGGGVDRVAARGRDVRFELVSEGRFRGLGREATSGGR